MLVCALLEDVAVLENLDAILAVPGIDLYGVGPMAGPSLGIPALLDHPEVVKATRRYAAHPPGGTRCKRT